MELNIKAQPAEWKGYALVRDKDGKPKIDGEWKDQPQPIIDMLTDDEYFEIFNEARK